LHFQNKELLKSFIEYGKSISEAEFEQIIEDYTHLGFNSLTVFNVNRKLKSIEQNNTNRSLSPIDLDGDSLIADDVFAATLNNNREIFVSDRMYLYTFEGIFTGEISDSSSIRNSSTTITTSAFSLDNGEFDLGNDIYRYIMRPPINYLDPNPIDPYPDPEDTDPCCGPGPGPGNGGTNTGSCTIDEEEIKRNLEIITHDGNFLFDI
jgi:hypothetical protein